MDSIIRAKTLEKFAETLEVPCPNRENGCMKAVPYLELDEHKKSTCDFKEIMCPRSGCEWRGTFAGLSAHFKDKHEDDCETISFGNYKNGYFTDLVENGSIDWDAQYVFHYHSDDGASFIFGARTVEHANLRYLAITVLFAGPEAERQKYGWTINIEGQSASCDHSGIPLPCQIMDADFNIHSSALFMLSEITLERMLKTQLDNGTGDLECKLKFTKVPGKANA